MKAQGKLLELIVGTIFVIFILIIIFFYYYANFNKEIARIVSADAYTKAMKTYKILQSDQIFAISSKDKGFLDKAKLEAVMMQSDAEYLDIDPVCEYLDNVVGGGVYVYIKDLETNEEFEICAFRKSMPMYFFDLYANIYDSYEGNITIAYLKIGVLS